MVLTAQEIANTRNHTLNNLLGLSGACLKASQRLSQLLTASTREALQHGSRQWSQLGHGHWETASQFPTALWLEHSSRHSQLFDQWLEILGEAQKQLIRSAENQVRVFDEIVFASIRHAEKSSPWEAEIALGALKTTLSAAESTLRGVSAAAIETVEIAEQEAHQIAGSLAESKPARKRATARSSNG